jgi:hypothetical protein
MGNEMETDSPEVARFLEQLRALPSAEEPAPSEELLALLNGTPAPSGGLAGARSRRTSWLAAAAVAAVVTGTGWAAAAGQLPGPVQDAFADFSEQYLPFELPHHGDGVRVDLDVDDPAEPDRTRGEDPAGRRDPAVAGTPGQQAPVGAGTTDPSGTSAGDGTAATDGTATRDEEEAEPDGDEDGGQASTPDDEEGTHAGTDDGDDHTDHSSEDSTEGTDSSDDATDDSDESTGSGSDGDRGSGDGSDLASGGVGD